MGEVYKVQVQQNGEAQVVPAPGHGPISPAQAPPEAVRIATGYTMAVQGDNVTVHERTSSEFSTATTPGTDSPLDNGCNPMGTAVSRDKLTEDSTVPYGGLKSVRIRELVTLGIVEPDPAGGFRMKAPSEKPAAEEAPKPAPSEYLDAASEMTIAEGTKRLGAATMFSIAERVLDGKDISEMRDMANRLGLEPHEVQHRITTTTQALTTQARQALHMSQEDFNVFSSWARAEMPEKVREAARAQFGKGDLSALRELGHAFEASGERYHPMDVLTADFGDGITASRDSNTGKVFLRIPGEGSMAFPDALRLGRIRVRRK